MSQIPTIIAYGTYGSVRGYGPLYATRAEAETSLRSDRIACTRGAGRGYSDRIVVGVDEDGACWRLDEDGEPLNWVPGPGGHRAAHYSISDVARVAGDVG